MQRAIRRHAARLASDGIYIENSNHGLMVDQALMDLSLQVPEFDRDLALYKKGADRFRKQILGIFDNAGFTKEHSISYQWYNAIVCQRIIDDHPSLIDEQSLELFEQQIAFRTLVLMEASKESDGCYLALGESSYEFPERHRLKLESLLNEEQKRILSLIRHNQVLRLFIPQAGFYFDKNDCYHFSLTIGRHSTVHKQDDDGSFTYSIKNRRVLIDPGYSAVKANVIYKSDKQHNTAALIDESGTVASFVASAESAASVQEFSDRICYTFVLKGIKGQLQRVITIRNDCFFEVEDSVLESSLLEKDWALEQRFCLAPDIEVSEVAPSFLMFKGQDNIPFMFCRLPQETSWSLVNDGIMAHDESPKLFKRLVVVSKDRSEPARVAFRPISADVTHGWIVREPDKKYPLGESILDSEKNAMCFYRVGQNIEKLTFGALFAEPPKANHIIGSDVNVTTTKDDVLLISPGTMCPKLLNILSDEIGQLQRNENFKVRGNAFVKEGGLCLGTFKQVKFSIGIWIHSQIGHGNGACIGSRL
ncbi:hypothetical protein TKWG_23365 [Advenella kashmirensis WT001]|uniref:Heparinase II/III-like C-terminal domain-containing protein n=1 Tax=Advenella kashmirensis (strain DSM 17095 / LMG 22695 / WT001) TaxID=1036672 RepID=I3UGY2_ADVKW|nr:heparinase II/III family protein [Advenella kashmirensis]AFK64270.1 hypothetical protein TKWG_23365 [Advenella kashmirensis WT001]